MPAQAEESMPDENAAREPVGNVVLDGPVRALTIDRTADRFEIRDGDDLAILTFRVKGSALSILHTEVPSSLRGQGLGEALAEAALDDAGKRGMTVKPYCPFVARYIEQHPEYRTLVDPTFTPTPTGADDATRE
jgi:predicted GNAT family acetyltransferase